jgi:predicted RNA methylase
VSAVADLPEPDPLQGIEVYDPATISDAKAREIEKDASQIVDWNNLDEAILHEVTFLRQDIQRLRRRVDNTQRLLIFVAIAVALIAIALWN